MGLWGTFIVAKRRPARAEDGEATQLLAGWRSFLVNEVLAGTADEIATTVGAGPGLLATVADSDYCRLVGVDGGEIRWTWSFGEAPWDPGQTDSEEADPNSTTERAVVVGQEIAEWAATCGLAPAAAPVIVDVLDCGYDFAEEGLFALERVLGLAADLDDPASPAAVKDAAPPARRVHIWNGPRRWLVLQFNTTADLYNHLDAVSAWLERARQAVIVPLMASYDTGLLQVSIDPHASVSGAPGGLLVRSGGWSTKNRPVFGAGDDAGWNRKLRQLSRRELREIKLEATAFGPSGHWSDGPGGVQISAVLRDQFVRNTPAPLPADHPGQLTLSARVEFLDRGVSRPSSVPPSRERLSTSSPISGRDSFGPGSGVKGIAGMPGCFEMTWAPDGRAILTYGKEVRPVETHVIWLAVGTHAILP